MSVEIPQLADGDLVDIIWDGGNGPHTYVVRIQYDIPLAFTTGPHPMCVSAISKTWVKSITKRPARKEE